MIPSLDDIKRYVEAAYNLPWWALAAVFSFLVCLALRRWGKFPNRLIPLSCLVLCAFSTAFGAPHHPENFRRIGWFVTNLMIGGSLGFFVWGFHNQVLKRLAAKFPWLEGILTGGDEDDSPALTPTAKSDSLGSTTGQPPNKP